MDSLLLMDEDLFVVQIKRCLFRMTIILDCKEECEAFLSVDRNQSKRLRNQEETETDRERDSSLMRGSGIQESKLLFLSVMQQIRWRCLFTREQELTTTVESEGSCNIVSFLDNEGVVTRASSSSSRPHAWGYIIFIKAGIRALRLLGLPIE